MSHSEKQVDKIVNTVTDLTDRFRENFGEKPVIYDAYEEEILDHALPRSGESDQYEFFLNDNYQFYLILFGTVILPLFLYFYYREWIADTFGWITFPLLAVGGLLIYLFSKTIILKVIHANRRKQRNAYWCDVRRNCTNQAERMERLIQNQNNQKHSERRVEKLTIEEVKDGSGKLPVISALDETGQGYELDVPGALGAFLERVMGKGKSVVIENPVTSGKSLSATQLISKRSPMFVMDRNGEKSQLEKGMLYDLYHRLHVAYLLSHKDAWSIVKQYEKEAKKREA
ncbi:hypothetical protein [Salisediminibacterium beveridgei]|uniref:Uncharacterized protein n=1 Tax=Salisediminibacterium beveridgei TaxID=632773 RepID=A0A1D7QZG7_9BACI|nr:hypothetical protein [Salisediminibacterium beveridgei]AOM84411.1 hypothetical protein BBEV_3094 [Salisediminibacterium beveridgei]